MPENYIGAYMLNEFFPTMIDLEFLNDYKLPFKKA
jgi:hypothetical protein